MSEDLKILVPDETVTTSQGAVTVKPFKFTQFPKVIAVIQNYALSLDSLNDLDISAIASLLTSDGGEGVFDLICLATGKDRDWLDSLEADDGINLVAKVVEVNLDFFAQKLTPSIEAFAQRIGKTSLTGEQSSADSSSTGTGGKTSKATRQGK